MRDRRPRGRLRRLRRGAGAPLALLRGLRFAGTALSRPHSRRPLDPLPYLRLARILGVLCLLAAFGGALGSCTPEPELPSDPELRSALGIADDRIIHRINLGGRGATEHVVPRYLEVRAGDIVQFAPVDRRVHAIVFRGDSLSAPAGEFLERTGQAASPPLMDPASRFVVSFEDAPPGAYPFTSQGHGDPVAGMIRVLEPGASPR